MPIDTLVKLRTAAKEEADKENDPSVTDPEWNRRVNEGYRALWNLVRSVDNSHFLTRGTATNASVVNNTLSSSLTNKRLRALWYVIGATADDYQRVRRWNMEERAVERSYQILGGSIYIYPASTAPGTYILWTENTWVELVVDGDAIDSRLIDWAEYVYLYAAIGARDKEESDTAMLQARLQRLEHEITSLAADYDAAEPARVVDTANRNWWRPPQLPDP